MEWSGQKRLPCEDVTSTLRGLRGASDDRGLTYLCDEWTYEGKSMWALAHRGELIDQVFLGSVRDQGLLHSVRDQGLSIAWLQLL